MASDAYGQPQPGYFDDSKEHTARPPAEPRDTGKEPLTSDVQRQSFPTINKMTAAQEYPGQAGLDNVSPELIAAITEKVTRQVTREGSVRMSRFGALSELTFK
jgi:hypothetical protein